jgi:hypothetical protein
MAQWGGICPFTFNTPYIPSNYQYDMDKNVLHFSCCPSNYHGEMTMTPNQILQLYTAHEGRTPCPTCYDEYKSSNLSQEGVNPDELPLPGEEMSDSILMNKVIAPDDPEERALLENKINNAKAAKEIKANESDGHGRINRAEQEALMKKEREEAEKSLEEETPLVEEFDPNAIEGEIVTSESQKESDLNIINSMEDKVVDKPEEVKALTEDKVDTFLEDLLLKAFPDEEIGEESADNKTDFIDEEAKFTDELTDRLRDQAEALGYDPWDDAPEKAVAVIFDHETGKKEIIAHCKFCEKEVSNENINVIVATVTDLDDGNIPYHACPHCIISMRESYETKGIYRNTLAMDRIAETLKKTANLELIILRNNTFTSPDEIIRFKDKKGVKYTSKIKDVLTSFLKEGESPAWYVIGSNEKLDINKINELINKNSTIDNNNTINEVLGEENLESIPVITIDDIETIKLETGTPPINEIKKEEIKKTKTIIKNYGGFEIEVEVDDDVSNDQETIIKEDHQSSPIPTKKLDQTIIPPKKAIVNDLPPKTASVKNYGGFEFEIEDSSDSLGKSKPHEVKKERENYYDGVTLAEHLSHEDPLKSHIDKEKETREKKWYNKHVFRNEEDEQINEFVDSDDLYEEFINSKSGQCLKMVEDKINNLTDKKLVMSSIYISDETYDIPIVDFNSGIRVICINCDNESEMKIPPTFETQVPFRFNMTGHDRIKYRKVYLYSDSVSTPRKFKASVQSLVKLVNREHFDPRRIINLTSEKAPKYALFYTDNQRIINEFEDLNTPNAYGKPNTHQIGIIALRNTVDKKQQFSSKDIIDYFNKTNYKFDMKNFNLYMVLTARYIAVPNVNTFSVTYTITDYVENAATIIKDGMSVIIGAIMKEHRKNYLTYKANFEWEFDPSALPSPSLEIMDDNGDLIPMMEQGTTGVCYIRKPDFRNNIKDGYRQDERLFGTKTLAKRFEIDLKKSGLNIVYPRMKDKFIESLGFFKYYTPKIKKFYINPMRVMKSEVETMLLTKIDINKFFSGSGIYDGSSDNLLLQKLMINMMNSEGGTDSTTKNIVNLMIMQNIMKS